MASGSGLGAKFPDSRRQIQFELDRAANFGSKRGVAQAAKLRAGATKRPILRSCRGSVELEFPGAIRHVRRPARCHGDRTRKITPVPDPARISASIVALGDRDVSPEGFFLPSRFGRPLTVTEFSPQTIAGWRLAAGAVISGQLSLLFLDLLFLIR